MDLDALWNRLIAAFERRRVPLWRRVLWVMILGFVVELAIIIGGIALAYLGDRAAGLVSAGLGGQGC